MSLSIYTQKLADCCDVFIAGGKAVNLGRLIRAGFAVPDGFVVTTRAYSLAQLTEAPTELVEEIRKRYQEMGGGAVAIRSSATAEDAQTASMAGQYETMLDVQGEQALVSAIRRCWASVDVPRTRAYLAERGIDIADVAMAVVVQRLVPADVAGVLFTSNPQDGRRDEMLLEASWGLGEMLVSGRVQPDVLRLDDRSGAVVEAVIADKRFRIVNGEEQAVQESRRRLPCLLERDVQRLWALGRRVAELFGSPQDIEWAIKGGDVYLIQSRPITTNIDSELREQILKITRQHLRQQMTKGHGPWALHNLHETLLHPTPLTWSVIRQFMSGSGGLGAMYRRAGFEPSPLVSREGFLDLIGGKVYMDASKAPEMFFADFPFSYDLGALKRSPDASQSPPTLPKGSVFARIKAGRKLHHVGERMKAMSTGLDRQIRQDVFEEMTAYVASAKPIDLSSVSIDWLIELWREHERMVLDTLAGQLLLPSLISGMAMAELRGFLQEQIWDEDCDELSQLLSCGGRPSRTVIADAELYQVGKGTRALEQWLAEHGHRAAGEFDLATPRWRERPEIVQRMAVRLAEGEGPLERYRNQSEQVAAKLLAIRSRLSQRDRGELDRLVDQVRRYIAFREDSKDFLMLGYDLLRDVALEAASRLQLGDKVFFLTRAELFDSLRCGVAPLQLIEQRRASYQAETRLILPRVIDAGALESLGEINESVSGSGGMKAFPISSGQATGPARILLSPDDAQELNEGYILVCPSTDPSWTPLFVNAAGLILECGGTLSHGAVVAREMGLPAVVLPDATRIFRDGEQLHVHGSRGWIGKRQTEMGPMPGGATSPPQGRPAGNSAVDDGCFLPLCSSHLPPPPGRKDRRAATLRDRLALAWSVYLLALFFLPGNWVYEPTFSVLDYVFWPIVRTAGKPAAVALIAVAIAIIVLMIQKLITDNRRLLEARKRAAVLKKQADLLAKDSPDRLMMLRQVTLVQIRTLMAALVPVGMLLGPMVLPFMWFQKRVDPIVSNAPPGSAVQIVAMVDSDWTDPVTIQVPPSVRLDAATPATRVLPPLRNTLEHLLVLYRQPNVAGNEPWELQVAPSDQGEQAADDLAAYLQAGIGPQGITWTILPPFDFSGRFTASVMAGSSPISVDVVLGDQYPPASQRVVGPPNHPVTGVKVFCPPSRQEPFFWRPLAGLDSGGHVPLAFSLAKIDPGWIGVYILAYLPALMLGKAILKIA